MVSIATERGITFGTVDGRLLELDLHLPAEPAGPLPLVIFIHGGGWMRGTRADYEDARQRPVAASGVVVASIDYRLSAEAPWPAQLHDVRTALERVPTVLADRGVILNGRTVLWGCSAGGHLALMTALTAREEDLPAPDAVVAWFPVTDLTLMDRAPKGPRVRNPHFVKDGTSLPRTERLLLGLDDSENGLAALRSASPAARVTHAAPPVLLVHGDEDALVPLHHSEIMHDALTASGSKVSTLTVRGATHEDPAFDSPEVLGAVAAFICAV